MFKNLFKKSQLKTSDYMKNTKEYFANNVGFSYPSGENNGREYQYIQSIIKKYFDGSIKYLAPELPMTRFRTWYLDNAFYKIVALKNKKDALEYFSMSTAYGYLSLLVNYKAARCLIPYRINYYSFSTINAYIAQCLISGYKEEYDDISRWFYNSIKNKDVSREKFVNNYETIYVDYDTDTNDSVWFLYFLYKKSHLIDIEIDNITIKKPYMNVLNIWDDNNLKDIERHIYMLSEYHIEKNKNNEFGSPIYNLFPYEILTWLKLRELKGLKNPKTFTHPLMNTPIAKMFLNIKEPLPYPQELPYAKELLEKLQEQCPDVEIPEWLKGGESDGLDRKEAEINKQNNAKGDDIIPDDFFAK